MGSKYVQDYETLKCGIIQIRAWTRGELEKVRTDQFDPEELFGDMFPDINTDDLLMPEMHDIMRISKDLTYGSPELEKNLPAGGAQQPIPIATSTAKSAATPASPKVTAATAASTKPQSWIRRIWRSLSCGWGARRSGARASGAS